MWHVSSCCSKANCCKLLYVMPLPFLIGFEDMDWFVSIIASRSLYLPAWPTPGCDEPCRMTHIRPQKVWQHPACHPWSSTLAAIQKRIQFKLHSRRSTTLHRLTWQTSVDLCQPWIQEEGCVLQPRATSSLTHSALTLDNDRFPLRCRRHGMNCRTSCATVRQSIRLRLHGKHFYLLRRPAN